MVRGNRGVAVFRFDGVVNVNHTSTGVVEMATAQRVVRFGVTLIEKHQRWNDMIVRTARKEHRCRTWRERKQIETSRTERAVSWRYESTGPELRHWDHGELPGDHTSIIKRGEQYVENMNESAPFQSGARYCVACALAAGIVTGGSPTILTQQQEPRVGQQEEKP